MWASVRAFLCAEPLVIFIFPLSDSSHRHMHIIPTYLRFHFCLTFRSSGWGSGQCCQRHRCPDVRCVRAKGLCRCCERIIHGRCKYLSIVIHALWWHRTSDVFSHSPFSIFSFNSVDLTPFLHRSFPLTPFSHPLSLPSLSLFSHRCLTSSPSRS